MARPKRTVRPINKKISLPETMVFEVDLLLLSELEGKLPHAAWSNYVQGLISFDLVKRKDLQLGKEARGEQSPIPSFIDKHLG